jgi:hypothetical protein
MFRGEAVETAIVIRALFHRAEAPVLVKEATRRVETTDVSIEHHPLPSTPMNSGNI